MLPADVFITLFYAILDTQTHSLVWANAGHDAPLHCRADATITTLDSSGRALGLLGGATYGEFQTILRPGSVLMMYTDGLSEARRDGRFLETSGVAEILLRRRMLSAREIVSAVYEEVREYTSGHLHDDIALLALKVNEDFAFRA
jgi:sigma-B regulation protein RsbU (phosphoserine phosphatase)